MYRNANFRTTMLEIIHFRRLNKDFTTHRTLTFTHREEEQQKFSSPEDHIFPRYI